MTEPPPGTYRPQPTGPAWNGRALRLPAPPTPAHAAELAELAVAAARNIENIELDYTPASLEQIDIILNGFRETGSDAVAETIFVFGCYIGEVMVRNAEYRWVDTPADLTRVLGPLTVYRSRTNQHTNPIGKAFKRVDDGAPASIAYFYHAIALDSR